MDEVLNFIDRTFGDIQKSQEVLSRSTPSTFTNI